MLNSEISRLYPPFQKDGVTYTLKYSCDDMIPIYDDNRNIVDYEIIGFNLIATAEEVYNQGINNIPIEPQPSEMEALTARVDGLENINAGLLLEIAMLKQN